MKICTLSGALLSIAMVKLTIMVEKGCSRAAVTQVCGGVTTVDVPGAGVCLVPVEIHGDPAPRATTTLVAAVCRAITTDNLDTPVALEIEDLT